MDFRASMATIRTQTANKIDFIWRRIKWNVIFVVNVRLIGSNQFTTPYKCSCALIGQRISLEWKSKMGFDEYLRLELTQYFDRMLLNSLQWNFYLIFRPFLYQKKCKSLFRLIRRHLSYRFNNSTRMLKTVVMPISK